MKDNTNIYNKIFGLWNTNSPELVNYLEELGELAFGMNAIYGTITKNGVEFSGVCYFTKDEKVEIDTYDEIVTLEMPYEFKMDIE